MKFVDNILHFVTFIVAHCTRNMTSSVLCLLTWFGYSSSGVEFFSFNLDVHNVNWLAWMCRCLGFFFIIFKSVCHLIFNLLSTWCEYWFCVFFWTNLGRHCGVTVMFIFCGIKSLFNELALYTVLLFILNRAILFYTTVNIY